MPIEGAVSVEETVADALEQLANGPTWFVGDMLRDGAQQLGSVPRNDAVRPTASIDDLRGSEQYRILTPDDDATELTRAGGTPLVTFHPMVGGIPPPLAIRQIRNDTPGRAYYEHKQTEGKTRKEALRALKRRISNAVYRRLVADAHHRR